jgi:hypothetical protein
MNWYRKLYHSIPFMRKLFVLLSLSILVVLSGFGISNSENLEKERRQSIEDSLQNDRDHYMNEVMASIKGKEKMRADSVFKNLKVIRGKGEISAEHLLWMMNWGWSAELGISCSYCHVPGKWESDEIDKKDIARGMWNMRQQINKEIMPTITGKNYDKNPKVTCITCHRGKPVPAND